MKKLIIIGLMGAGFIAQAMAPNWKGKPFQVNPNQIPVGPIERTGGIKPAATQLDMKGSILNKAIPGGHCQYYTTPNGDYAVSCFHANGSPYTTYNQYSSERIEGSATGTPPYLDPQYKNRYIGLLPVQKSAGMPVSDKRIFFVEKLKNVLK